MKLKCFEAVSNPVNDAVAVMSAGRLFHNVGTATLKVQLP